VVGSWAFARRGPGDRWAVTGIVVALAVAGWGWLSELAHDHGAAGGGSHQLAWVPQDQGAGTGPVGDPYGVAWGLPTGVCLMVLLLAALAAAGRLRRGR
jgi:hypothetical protein